MIDQDQPHNPIRSNDSEKRERPGIQLNFAINDPMQITQILYRSDLSSEETRPDIAAIQNHARSLSPEMFEFTRNRYTTGNYAIPEGDTEETFHQKYDIYIQQVIETPEYQRVRQQTKDFLQKCQSQWEQNYVKSAEIIRTITGVDLNKSITVYIYHPSLNTGSYYAQGNIINWGHEDIWPNYTSVYLWHEIMHSYLGNSDVEHAVIQLLTDNELRVKLNGGSYGNPDLPLTQRYEGHPNLFPLMNKLLPDWQRYIDPDNNKRRNINDFIQTHSY